jgi:hypothetical protein
MTTTEDDGVWVPIPESLTGIKDLREPSGRCRCDGCGLVLELDELGVSEITANDWSVVGDSAFCSDCRRERNLGVGWWNG